MEKSVHMITYGDQRFRLSKARLAQEATESGFFKTVTSYGIENIDSDFKEKVKLALRLRRKKGGGYWIWKPYLIKKRLSEINEGEYLIYLDAGCSVNKDGHERFNEYLDLIANSEYGSLGLQLPHVERVWTKKEVLEHFGLSSTSEIATSGQVIATIIVLKKNAHSEKLVDLWYSKVIDHLTLFTDTKTLEQEEYFRDHRHDQSVFSIIRKMHGSVLISDDSWYEDWSDGSLIPFLAKRINDKMMRKNK
jgi:hypothetical protein